MNVLKFSLKLTRIEETKRLLARGEESIFALICLQAGFYPPATINPEKCSFFLLLLLLTSIYNQLTAVDGETRRAEFEENTDAPWKETIKLKLVPLGPADHKASVS